MQDNKILAVIKKKNGEVSALRLSLRSFGTVDLGLAQVPIKELDTWLKALYNYKLIKIKYKDHTVKFY